MWAERERERAHPHPSTPLRTRETFSKPKSKHESPPYTPTHPAHLQAQAALLVHPFSVIELPRARPSASPAQAVQPLYSILCFLFVQIT